MMTWGGVHVAKPPVMPRGVGVGPHPWDCLHDCLRGTLIKLAAKLKIIIVSSQADSWPLRVITKVRIYHDLGHSTKSANPTGILIN